MRTFIALDIPDEIKDEISSKIESYKKVHSDGINWVIKENLHITFQFIGKTKHEDLNAISELISILFKDASKLNFYAPKLEIIPGKNPKIIWIGMKTNNKKIFTISKKIRCELRQLGYQIESRSLRIHITLGRIKKTLPKKLIHKILTTELKFEDISVDKVALYKSLLRPSGPVYEEIGHINL